MTDRLRFACYVLRFVPCMALHLVRTVRYWAAEQRRALWGGYCRQRTGQG